MTAGPGSETGRQFALNLNEGFAAAAQPGASRLASTRPFSIRLSAIERQTLKQEAGQRPLGTYVRARLLDGAARRSGPTVTRCDAAAMSKLLAQVGRLQWSASMAELTTAAKRGTIVISPELEREIAAVCADIREVRQLLFRALGLSPGAGR